MNQLNCKISKRGEGYVGTVSMPGLAPTRLARTDGTSVYSTLSGVTQSARALAKRYNLSLNIEGQKNTATTTKTAKTNTRKTTTLASGVVAGQ